MQAHLEVSDEPPQSSTAEPPPESSTVENTCIRDDTDIQSDEFTFSFKAKANKFGINRVAISSACQDAFDRDNPVGQKMQIDVAG